MINPRHVTWILGDYNVKCKIPDVKCSEKLRTLILYRLKPEYCSFVHIYQAPKMCQIWWQELRIPRSIIEIPCLRECAEWWGVGKRINTPDSVMRTNLKLTHEAFACPGIVLTTFHTLPGLILAALWTCRSTIPYPQFWTPKSPDSSRNWMFIFNSQIWSGEMLFLIFFYPIWYEQSCFYYINICLITEYSLRSCWRFYSCTVICSV